MTLMAPDVRPTRPTAHGAHRGASRRRAGVVLALLALLAQSSLPHLHDWLAGRHGAETASATTATTVAAARDGDDRSGGGHAESGCPTCQALAQSRLFLASGTVLPRPLAVTIAQPETTAAHAANTRPLAHAPRSPPRAA